MKLSFGTGSAFSGLPQHHCNNLVRVAFENHIHHFDTGSNYGRGTTEVKLGQALRSLGQENYKQCTVSSKAGTVSKRYRSFKCFDPKYLSSCLETSLLRLGVESLDIFYLHGPTIQELSSPSTLSFLDSVLSSGKVKSVGVNTHSTAVIRHLSSCSYNYTDIMLDYNLLQLDRSQYFDQLCTRGIRISAGTVYCQGLLLAGPLAIFLRSRNLFYPLRFLLKPSSRRFISPARRARQILDSNRVPRSHSLLLAYNDPRISFVPIGMTSVNSIISNVACSQNSGEPFPASLVHSFASCQVKSDE